MIPTLPRARLGAFLVLLGLVASAPAQATLTQITTVARQRLDAQISPDGNFVAFRVGSVSLGLVGVQNQVENLIYNSTVNGLTHFTWGPASTTLYFVDGNTVRAVPRGGGSALTLGTIAGSSVAVWTTSTDGTKVFGSRLDTNGMGHLFQVQANGGGLPVDLVSAPGVIDDVRSDASGRWLLFRNWSGVPFTPVQYWRHDLTGGTGQSQVYASSLTLTDNVQAAWWADNGQDIVFTTNSPNVSQQHVGRAGTGTGGSLQLLTDFQYFTRRTYVRPGSRWILCETASTYGVGVSVGVMPLGGGGLVQLEPGRALWFNAGSTNSLTMGLTIDASDTRIAVCAGTSPTDPAPQIYVASLDREIRVHPRLVPGGSFQIDLPAAVGELGAVVVAFGLTAGAPFPVPPIGGLVYLDPTPGASVTVISGLGNGSTPLTGSWSLPANPGLVGVRLFFQGVRFDATLLGSFTRWGHYVVL